MSGHLHAVDATNSGQVGMRTNDCSAWIHYETNGTVSIEQSYNVKSITDQGTGSTDVNYLRPLQNTSAKDTGSANGDECCVLAASSQVNVLVGANDRNGVRIDTRNDGNSGADTDNICVGVFS
jgi:hypothetical protein|tara:strand:+ start:511 stop:879 length:369 start_codon:yes stop_codon:yes gene_type:complete